MVYKDKHKHEHNQYYNVPIHYRAPWEVNPRTVRSQVNLYELLDFTHDLSCFTIDFTNLMRLRWPSLQASSCLSSTWKDAYASAFSPG